MKCYKNFLEYRTPGKMIVVIPKITKSLPRYRHISSRLFSNIRNNNYFNSVHRLINQFF